MFKYSDVLCLTKIKLSHLKALFINILKNSARHTSTCIFIFLFPPQNHKQLGQKTGGCVTRWDISWALSHMKKITWFSSAAGHICGVRLIFLIFRKQIIVPPGATSACRNVKFVVYNVIPTLKNSEDYFSNDDGDVSNVFSAYSIARRPTSWFFETALQFFGKYCLLTWKRYLQNI